MSIKELLAKHGVDNAELQVDLESLLSTAESKKTDGIPYARFKEKVEEVRNLQADKAELENKVTGLEKEIETNKTEVDRLKGIETEFNTYQEKQFETAKSEFEKIVEQLSVKETDPKHEQYKKVLGKFKLGTKEEPLTKEQIERNLEIYNLAKELGGLDSSDKNFEDGKSPKPKPSDIPDPLIEAFGGK